MNLRINKLKINKIIIENFYWIIMIGYVISIFIPSFSIVFLSSFLLLIICFFNLTPNNKVNFGLFYILYLISSGCLYFFNDLPINLYFMGMMYVITPITFYIIPKNSFDIENFFNKSFSAILFSFIMAIIFYLWWPDSYRNYCITHGYISAIAGPQSSMQGIYGITLLGSFSACSTIYFLGHWMRVGNLNTLLKLIFSFLIVLLSGRRSAIASCILFFIIEYVIYFKRYKKNKKKYIIFILFLITCIIVFVTLYNKDFIALWERVTGITEAIGERKGNWKSNLNNINNRLLLGKGIGSGGHLAGSYGFMAVNDCSYIMLLVENGLIGLIIFSIVVIQSLFLFIASKKKNFIRYVSFYIVLIFLIQAIGSNVFEFPTLSALFWFSLSTLRQNNNNFIEIVY